MFILGRMLNDENNDAVELFKKYLAYLDENKEKFPKNAYKLATSDWYYNPHHESHGYLSPHDSWLENMTIQELHCGERQEKRLMSISIKLLGAFHNGYIVLHYPIVYSYSLNVSEKNHAHCDWVYDEFRLSDDGNLIHEIEWRSGVNYDDKTWVIEASDIIYSWVPVDFSRLDD